MKLILKLLALSTRIDEWFVEVMMLCLAEKTRLSLALKA